jgi:hypothetical protein
MENSDQLDATIKEAAGVIGSELQGFVTNSVQSSHSVASYALENVLLHQAAAQQLQVMLANRSWANCWLQLTTEQQHAAAAAAVAASASLACSSNRGILGQCCLISSDLNRLLGATAF